MVNHGISRREILAGGALAAVAVVSGHAAGAGDEPRGAARVFDVRAFGAVGDGKTSDTAAIQRAVDAAAAVSGGTAGKPRVLVGGGKKYLIGTVVLKGGIDFHLADDAELLISIDRADYTGEAAIVADGAVGLRISGTGSINGRSPEVMTQYDAANEWWWPAPAFRPRMVVLTACRDLEILGVTLKQAPLWTLHLLGCERVVIDGIKIRNQLDVPNCDGIDPDHCRDVEIKNCDIVCGDDAIVIKATRQTRDFGWKGCERITVRDCTIETQDSALKIGTETTADIKDILFERCTAKACCRGLTIQLRDAGNVSKIVFRDIAFTSRYFSDPWWGRGEAISLTAIPRTAGGKVGTIDDVLIQNVRAVAENSVRVEGSADSRIKNVRLEEVSVKIDRWTKYPGGIFDNRPTKAQPDLVKHNTPAFSFAHADGITMDGCSATWGEKKPDYFSHALETVDVTGLKNTGFTGEAAHPERDKAILMSS